jgi:hypothetical protein
MTLGTLISIGYEQLRISPLPKHKVTLHTLNILRERNFFEEHGLTLKKSKKLETLYKKYDSLIKLYTPLAAQIDKLRGEYLEQIKKQRNPFTITFQWWDFEPMDRAFPRGESRNGIRRVKDLLTEQFPNLIIFETWEEIFLQMGIYAHQAGLMSKSEENSFIDEFWKLASPKLSKPIEKLFKGEMVALKILKNYDMRFKLGTFWKYVKDKYRWSFNTSGLDIGEETKKSWTRLPESTTPGIDSMSEEDEEVLHKPSYSGRDQRQTQNSKTIIEDSPTYSPLQMAQGEEIKQQTLFRWLERGKVKSARKEGARWVLNTDAQNEIRNLARHLKKRINHNGLKIQVKIYKQSKGIKLESAKRYFSRFLKDSERGKLTERRKENFKKILGKNI